MVHPEVDPLQLMKKCLVASFAGYWVGKFLKRKEGLFALGFSLPLVIKYVYDEWRLSKDLKEYLSFSI
jgi:hypothetical protein